MKAHLGGRIGVRPSDWTGQASKAAPLATGSARLAANMAPACGDVVTVEFEGPDRTGGEAGPLKTGIARAGLWHEGRQIDRRGEGKGAAIGVPQSMIGMDQDPDRRWRHRLGPLRPALEARALAAGLPAVFTPRRPDLLPVLHLCAALVVPSRQEAFGRVLIEAMAAGVPVVATRVGGIPEVCLDGRTGLLVPPEDPVALASAILATLTQPEATRARVRAAAKDVHTRFSLTRHAERVATLYTQLRNAGHTHAR